MKYRSYRLNTVALLVKHKDLKRKSTQLRVKLELPVTKKRQKYQYQA